MIKNFLTVAIRNFFRQKFYSILNVLGLASGLTCALLIYFWVNDEVSKNRFHQEGDHIFRVVSNLQLTDGQTITWDITPGPLAEDILDNDPEVEIAVRTLRQGAQLLQAGERSFLENGLYADPAFFQLFSFDVIAGKPSTDTADVSHISISQSLADKLFPDSDALGKTVTVDMQNDYQVTAVFADVGTESSLQFDYILPFEVFRKSRGAGFNWGNYDHPLYVKLTNPEQVEQVMERINARRAAALKAANDSDNIDFYFQPFSQAYLHGHFENGKPSGGRIQYVRIFSVVAIFILVIACINFTNMATARAVTRSREVGIRKVVGAQRKYLIVQFLGESILLSIVAMLVAIGAVYTLLPLFNTLVGKHMAMSFSEPGFLIAVVAITLATGILAGGYPALFLSAYQPAHVLKGTLSVGSRGGALRQGLVIFQFTLTVILIACSLVIYSQIGFIMNKNVGYQKSAILSFSGPRSFLNAFESFRNDALQYPAITHVSRSNESLIQVQNQNSSFAWSGKPDDSEHFFRTVVVDYGFLETMAVSLKEGRFFSPELNDTGNFVITSRAQEVMGLTDPIGQEVSQWGMKGKVVGIVNDVHSRSMHENIDPVVFLCKPEWTGRVFVRFGAASTSEAVDHIENVYKKYSPEFPFTYSFLEDDFERLYNNEKVTAALGLVFTLMAVLISGLGLLGLAAYTSERRKKEISIRKTMGASVLGIVAMMSKGFARLSLIAILIGCPLAWMMMEKFLGAYAYRTELRWETFAVISLLVLVTALVTVIYQVTRAALANPVDALRNE